MAEVQLTRSVDGPGTHALVIGISRYPHLEGPQQSKDGRRYGLTNLTTAARSASEIARWLLEDHYNPAAPLASLTVLLSPVEGETIAEAVATRLAAPFAATTTAVRRAFGTFRERCQTNAENVGFVYVAGHGVQLTKEGAIVLLEDFASPEHLNALDGAIDMRGLHNAFNGSGYAANQAWFVDACRQRTPVAARFEKLAGAFTLDEPPGDVRSSPLYLASSSQMAAFANPGGMTLFSTALLAALGGEAASGPDRLCDDWHVSAYSLGDLLPDAVGRLAAEGEEEQRVDVTGRVINGVIHRFENAPEVDLRIELSPSTAFEYCSASLYRGGEEEVLRKACDWPLRRRVRAGLYTLWVDTEAPFRSIAGRPGFVRPLEYVWPVEVS